MTRLLRRAPAFLAGLALLVACTGGPSTEGGGRASTAPPTSGTTPSTPTAFVVPAQHASDWAAPDEPRPDVTLPYGTSPLPTAERAFYDLTTLDPAEVAAASRGAVLRSEQVRMTGPLDGVSGIRILYRSIDADGAPAVVSGIVLIPPGTAPPAGRPVVAWAHGTTGIADRCAPSATTNLFYDDYGQEGRDLLDQGFVVTATDYHGLGTPGVHTYHRSKEMAAATIDSVSAAHHLGDVGSLRPEWFVVGHSEGGLAALATDAIAQKSLPELAYRGAVVAAPTPPLATFAPAMFAIKGRGYAVLLLEAAAKVAPDLDPAVALGPEAARRITLVTHGCWEEAVPGFDDIDPDKMLASPDVGRRLAEVMETWAAYDPATIQGPMLVVQGEADDSVLPPITAKLVDDLCVHRRTVEYRTYAQAGHDEVMAASHSDAASWLASRLAGSEPPTSCPG
jgi:pimeloyl-ACP methyl ester carboxylesterase